MMKGPCYLLLFPICLNIYFSVVREERSWSLPNLISTWSKGLLSFQLGAWTKTWPGGLESQYFSSFGVLPITLMMKIMWIFSFGAKKLKEPLISSELSSRDRVCQREARVGFSEEDTVTGHKSLQCGMGASSLLETTQWSTLVPIWVHIGTFFLANESRENKKNTSKFPLY